MFNSLRLFILLVTASLSSTALAKTPEKYLACLNKLNALQVPQSDTYIRQSANSHYIITKNGGANLTDSTTVKPGFLNITPKKIESCAYRITSKNYSFKHNGAVITMPPGQPAPDKVFEVNECKDITQLGGGALVENQINAQIKKYAEKKSSEMSNQKLQSGGLNQTKSAITRELKPCEGLARSEELIKEELQKKRTNPLLNPLNNPIGI